jgi:hypothetical protein
MRARYKRLSASPVTPFWGHSLSILGSWGTFCLLSCLGYDYQSRPVWASSVASGTGLPLGASTPICTSVLWSNCELYYPVYFAISSQAACELILVLIGVRGTGSCSLLRSGQSGTCRCLGAEFVLRRTSLLPVGLIGCPPVAGGGDGDGRVGYKFIATYIVPREPWDLIVILFFRARSDVNIEHRCRHAA